MTKHKEKKCKCKWPNGAILKGITERGGWICSKCGEEIKDVLEEKLKKACVEKFIDLLDKDMKARELEMVEYLNRTVDATKTNNWS